MALLFLDSFDHYQTADLQMKWTSGNEPILVGQGRCGTNCLDCEAGTVRRGLLFGSSAGTVGYAFKMVLGIFDSPQLRVGNLETDHLLITWFSDGSMGVYRVGSPDELLCQSAPNICHVDVWYYVELRFLIDMAVGFVTLRINDVVVASATGVKTLGNNTPGAYYPAPTLRQLQFINPSNRRYFVDDLYVLDNTGPAPWNDFLGDSHVEYLRPRAAGSAQQWTPVGAPSHWQAVDDGATPDGDTTYVESATPGQTDTNRYMPTGLPSGPVFGAQFGLLARKTEVGPRVIAPVCNGVVGASVGPSYESYQYYLTPYGANPATGTAWTIASINAAEFGVTIS